MATPNLEDLSPAARLAYELSFYIMEQCDGLLGWNDDLPSGQLPVSSLDDVAMHLMPGHPEHIRPHLPAIITELVITECALLTQDGEGWGLRLVLEDADGKGGEI